MRIPKYKAYLKNYKMIVDVESINFTVKTVYVQIGEGDPYEFNFDEIELMAYTGLNDINGVEIYEGYKCKYPEGISYDIEVIRYSDIYAHYWCGNAVMGATKLEVVGSIYEEQK